MPNLGDVIDFDSSTLFMDGADNRVGIRNTNPQYELDVTGTVNATNFRGNISVGTIDDWITHTGDTDTKIGFSAADTFQVYAGGGPRLTVNSTGLQVSGIVDTTVLRRQVQNSSVIIAGGNATNDGANIAMYGSTHSSQAGNFEFRSGGTYVLKIKSDGTVGINVTNPDSTFKLDLNGKLRVGSGSGGQHVMWSRAGLTAELVIGVDGYGNAVNNEATIQSGTGRPLVFMTNGGERLRLTSDGDIVTQSLTGTSFDNDGDNTKVLEVTGDGTLGEYGQLNLSGNQNTHGNAIGVIKFINRENAHSSSGSGATSRSLGAIEVRASTDDSNAGDDSGGYFRFVLKSDGGGNAERLRIKGNGSIYTVTQGAKFGISQDPELTTMGSTSGTWQVPEVDGATIGAEMRIGDHNTNSTALIRLASYGSGDGGVGGGAIMFTNTRCGSASHHSDLAAIKGARESLGKGYLRFFTASSAANTEKMRITSGGDVGIGTINPQSNFAAGTTTTKFAVVTQKNVEGAFHETAHFSAGGDDGETGAIVRIGQYENDRGLYIKGGQASSDRATARFGLRNSGATDTDVLTLYQDGSEYRVGIGDNSPDSKLEVQGAYNIHGLKVTSGASGYSDPLIIRRSTGGDTFRVNGAGAVLSESAMFDHYQHFVCQGGAGGNSVNNYLLVCKTNNTNIRLAGEFVITRSNGTSGIAISRIEANLISNNSSSDWRYQTRSMSTKGSYPGVKGQWVTLTYGSNNYYALRLDPVEDSDRWPSKPDHCFFKGTANGCVGNGLGTVIDSSNNTITNVTELNDRQGVTVLKNSDSFVHGKIKYGDYLQHGVQGGGFSLYPNNGSNNKTTIRVAGLVSGCFIFQMGYYNSSGQGEGGFACSVSGYMTSTNQYTIDNIKNPYAHANSSISSISKQNSYFEFTITNDHSSYTGGGTWGIIGNDEMTVTVTYSS